MALPLAKLHSVRGFSWSLLRHLIIIRFCLLNFFSLQSKQKSLEPLREVIEGCLMFYGCMVLA